MPINIGNGMDGASGEFTAPVKGNYAFFFSAVSSGHNGDVVVGVYKNDEKSFRILDANDADNYNNIAYSWMTEMTVGESIKLSVGSHKLFADSDDIIHFNGFLL